MNDNGTIAREAQQRHAEHREKRRRELLDAYNAAIRMHDTLIAEARAQARTADQYAQAYEREGFKWPDEEE